MVSGLALFYGYRRLMQQAIEVILEVIFALWLPLSFRDVESLVFLMKDVSSFPSSVNYNITKIMYFYNGYSGGVVRYLRRHSPSTFFCRYRFGLHI